MIVGSVGALALHVEIIQFEASRINDEQVLLQWQTASELKTTHFEIETSANGQHFETLDEMNGVHHINNYRLVVNNAEAAYYRLKQMNNDGSVHDTRSRYVEAASLRFSLEVYSNPSQGGLNIRVAINAEMLSLSLIDLQGQEKGRFEGTPTAINQQLWQAFAKLENGLYLVKVQSKTSQTWVKRVVLNR